MGGEGWALLGPIRYFARWARRPTLSAACRGCAFHRATAPAAQGSSSPPALVRRLPPSRRRVERRRPATGSLRLRKFRPLYSSVPPGSLRCPSEPD
jgi:hypothetical protein